MNYLYRTAVLFLCVTIFSMCGQQKPVSHQKTKHRPTLYYNYNNDPISKHEFKNSDPWYFAKARYENDSSIIAKQIPVVVQGKLSAMEKEDIFSLLEKTVHEKIDLSKTIVIHYYYAPCSYIAKELNNTHYFDVLERFPEFAPYFISEKGFTYQSKNPTVHEDVYNFLPRIFFKKKLNCVNYVVIKPNGIFTVIYGKRDPVWILDYSV